MAGPFSREQMEERQIIRLAKDGNRDAFETLVRSKREKVFWVAYQTVGNEDDAWDISQQVFIRVWRSLHRYDEQYAFNTWLHTITVRLAIDFLRRQRRKRTLTEPYDEAEPGAARRAGARTVSLPDEDMERAEIQRIFNHLADFLTDRQRSIFVLREMQGLSMKEIAEVMGCRQSTVRNHLFQARNIMKQKLARHYPEYAAVKRGGPGRDAADAGAGEKEKMTDGEGSTDRRGGAGNGPPRVDAEGRETR